MGIITIAFDDGYKDTFEHCADFLAENRIKATFAIPSSYIGKTLEHRPVVSEDQLRELVKSGHEIAAHSTGHRNLLDVYNSEGEEAALKEITESKKDLGSLLDTKIESFVFPFIEANHNDELLKLASRHYRSSRITTDGFAFNKFPVKAPCAAVGTAITLDHPISEYYKLVEIVSTKDLWLIEVFHLVSDKNTKSAHRDAPYRFFTHIETFKEHIRYILSKKILVITQSQVVQKYGRVNK